MAELAATRAELQRVATHLLARRRHDVTGRFGLRATPGGFGTPAFGPPEAIEVVRVAGGALVREVGGDASSTPLAGATLGELAEVVDVDLAAPFSAGHDTPPVGDAAAPIAVDPGHAAAIAEWFDLGWRAIDLVGVASAGSPSTTQLWPEHFDAAAAVPFGPDADDRANVGASPGDGFHEEPYLYVGPWGSGRPGDPAYWNAPFGAVLGRARVASLDDAVAFLQRGIDLLRG